MIGNLENLPHLRFLARPVNGLLKRRASAPSLRDCLRLRLAFERLYFGLLSWF